jgi:DNA-directed RNA polymerase specialized sigma24 family protein
MSGEHDERSVSSWIDKLKTGDQDAAAALWLRYRDDLLRYARRKLLDGPRRAVDEEDVALSAFHSLCRGAQRDVFEKLDDRSDLWQLLMMLSARKAARKRQTERRKKRGGGNVRGDSAFVPRDGGSQEGFEQIAAAGLSPDFLPILEDELQRLMRATGDEDLREIALLRMEGHSNKEIAQKTGRALRSVERKLQLIRQIWEQSPP